MIRVTFLGVGAALPVPGQTNCSYLIETDGACILFDCGPAVLQQFAAVSRDPGCVTHVFISHAHGDHALGWPMFLLFWGHHAREQGAVPPHLITSDVTRAHLKALWEHSFNDVPPLALPVTELPADRGITFRLWERITLATWPMVHSTVSPVLAARFTIGDRVLALTADAARHESIVDLARGADLLIHDARHALTVAPKRELQSKFHCAAQDAGEYAAAAGVRELALVHIGAEYASKHAELAAEAKAAGFAGRVFVPQGGEIWSLTADSGGTGKGE